MSTCSVGCRIWLYFDIRWVLSRCSNVVQSAPHVHRPSTEARFGETDRQLQEACMQFHCRLRDCAYLTILETLKQSISCCATCCLSPLNHLLTCTTLADVARTPTGGGFVGTSHPSEDLALRHRLYPSSTACTSPLPRTKHASCLSSPPGLSGIKSVHEVVLHFTGRDEDHDRDNASKCVGLLPYA